MAQWTQPMLASIMNPAIDAALGAYGSCAADICTGGSDDERA